MQGVIKYKDKEGKEQNFYFNGMRYGESTAEFLKQRGVEYSEILECWTED